MRIKIGSTEVHQPDSSNMMKENTAILAVSQLEIFTLVCSKAGTWQHLHFGSGTPATGNKKLKLNKDSLSQAFKLTIISSKHPLANPRAQQGLNLEVKQRWR